MENENKVVPEVTNEEIVESTMPDDESVVENVEAESVETEEKLVENRCPNCQALINDSQAFCPECGNLLKKVCKRCGAELQDNITFCHSCGLNVTEAFLATSININKYNTAVMNGKKKPKKLKIILGVIIAICLCVVLAFLLNGSGKATLYNKLMEDEWTGISSDGDTILYLDFSENEIDYSGYFGVLGKCNIGTIDYEVISKDKISVRGREINVRFSDDGDTVTFSPSFTDTRSATVWTK